MGPRDTKLLYGPTTKRTKARGEVEAREERRLEKRKVEKARTESAA